MTAFLVGVDAAGIIKSAAVIDDFPDEDAAAAFVAFVGATIHRVEAETVRMGEPFETGGE